MAVPKELFHYTTKEAALEHILLTGKILLNPLRKTNDPRESKALITIMIEFLATMAKKELGVNLDTLRRLLDNQVEAERRNDWKILCFSMSKDKALSVFDETSTHHHFKLGGCRARMWSQYAKNHTGVCLVFDGHKLASAISKQHSKKVIKHGPVKYSDGLYPSQNDFKKLVVASLPQEKNTDALHTAAQRYIKRNYKYLFLRKYSDWRDESEYRWIIHSPNKEVEFVTIRDSISAVILGESFSHVYYPAVKDICKKLRIPAGPITWTAGIPLVMMGTVYSP